MSHPNLLELCYKRNPDWAEIDQLVRSGVEVNCFDENGTTPLLVLLMKHRRSHHSNEGNSLIETIQVFIEHGVDITHRDKFGANALIHLCRNNNIDNLIDFIQLLTNARIDVNCKNDNGWNALHALCRYYDKENLIDIVRLLIENGIDVKCRNSDGWNALHFLCRHYHNENLIDIIQVLILEDIDVNCKDKYGWNALHILCSFYPDETRARKIIDLLINRGIQTNVKTTKWNYDLRPLLQEVGSMNFQQLMEFCENAKWQEEKQETSWLINIWLNNSYLVGFGIGVAAVFLSVILSKW